MKSSQVHLLARRLLSEAAERRERLQHRGANARGAGRRERRLTHLEHIPVGAAPESVNQLVVLQRVQERHPDCVHVRKHSGSSGGTDYARIAKTERSEPGQRMRLTATG